MNWLKDLIYDIVIALMLNFLFWGLFFLVSGPVDQYRVSWQLVLLTIMVSLFFVRLGKPIHELVYKEKK